jgi:rare lipoprotein A
MAAAAQPRVQEPVRARPTAETAYAAAPSEKMPKVMFGNMLLEPPKAGQKPAY